MPHYNMRALAHVCGGISLYWTPLQRGKASLIERSRNLRIEMYTILMPGTAQAVLIRGCPYFRGVLIENPTLCSCQHGIIKQHKG